MSPILTDDELPVHVGTDESFLTRQQLARLLGDASESYVDNLIAKGHLISVTIGRRVLVPVSSYRAYVARAMKPR